MDKDVRGLEQFLSSGEDVQSIYLSDKRKRHFRKLKGLYSKSSNCFDFIYLIQNWQKIVGKLLGENTIPRKISKGTLYIIVKHSVFTQELQMMSSDIIDKITQTVPALNSKIRRLKFTNANFSAQEFLTSKREHQKSYKDKKVAEENHRFSPKFLQKKAKAHENFKDIEDEELKKLLCSIFIKRL